MKTVYLYDPQSHEFLHAHECQINSINNKEYDVPWNSLPIAPPETGKNETAVADLESGKWEVKADYRNAKGYSTENGQEVEIKELGKLPEDITLEARPSEYHSFVKDKWTITKADQQRKQADEAKAHNQQIYTQIDELETHQQRPLREAALAKNDAEKKAALKRVQNIDDQINHLRTTLKPTE